jgi:hypothetical protein
MMDLTLMTGDHVIGIQERIKGSLDGAISIKACSFGR